VIEVNWAREGGGRGCDVGGEMKLKHCFGFVWFGFQLN